MNILVSVVNRKVTGNTKNYTSQLWTCAGNACELLLFDYSSLTNIYPVTS